MFLNYHQQYDLVNQHRRELEAVAAKARLCRSLGKPRIRVWTFAGLLTPHVVGTGSWERTEFEQIPVAVSIAK